VKSGPTQEARDPDKPGVIRTEQRLSNLIDTLLKLLSYLEEGKLLWRNRYLLAGLRIPPFVGSVLLDYEAPKASDLNPATIYQGVTHLSVHKVHNLF
jgi:hypothetical protein